MTKTIQGNGNGLLFHMTQPTSRSLWSRHARNHNKENQTRQLSLDLRSFNIQIDYNFLHDFISIL